MRYYYFGVSGRESRCSLLPQNKAKTGTSSYLSLSSYHVVKGGWQPLLIGQYQQVSDTVKDSPMANRDSGVMLANGVLYKF